MNGFSGAHLVEFADRLIMSAIYGGNKTIDQVMILRELKSFDFKVSADKTIGLI
jgi:hypothetical protein